MAENVKLEVRGRACVPGAGVDSSEPQRTVAAVFQCPRVRLRGMHDDVHRAYTFAERSRSALITTDSDEALIAKAAKIGPIKRPRNG